MGRFGDSVTPAMIANAKPTTSNWERKRYFSRQRFTFRIKISDILGALTIVD